MLGDDLTIRTTLFSTALALASLAVSQAGWKDPLLIGSLFAVAGLLFLASVFWPMLSRRVGALGRLTAFVNRTWNTKFLFRILSVLLFLPTLYVTVRFAVSHAQTSDAPNADKGVTGIVIDNETPVFKAYKEDFKNNLRLFVDIDFSQVGGPLTSRGNQQLVINFESNTEFMAFYIPYSDLSYSVCMNLPQNYKTLLEHVRKLSITRQSEGESGKLDAKSLVFSNLIYLYTDKPFDLEQLAALQKKFRERGLSVQVKDISNVKWGEHSAH